MSDITLRDFSKLEMRIATIKAAKKHPRTSDYVLLLNIGQMGAPKQAVVDLKDSYTMDELIGKQVVCVINLEPVAIKGMEAGALLLFTHNAGRKELLQPKGKVHDGVEVAGLMGGEVRHRK